MKFFDPSWRDRDTLTVDQIYYSEADDLYFVAGPRRGGYWYETRQGASDQHGAKSVISVPGIND